MTTHLNRSSLIFNPVLPQPWKKQTRKYDNPRGFLGGSNEKKRKNPAKRFKCKEKSKREQNLKRLMMRFPDLQQQIARASLTLSNNRLELAVLHIELKYGLQKNLTPEGVNLADFTEIRLSMTYGSVGPDIVLRNITYESRLTAEENASAPEVKKSETRCVRDSDSQDSRPVRVGVVIKKTERGYRAMVL